MEFVLCRLDGSPLASRVKAFSGDLRGLEDFILSGLSDLVAEAGATAPILGIGVSLPGLVNNEGILVHVPVLGWRDVDIVERLGRVCPAPVFVGNDGKAAAIAEHMFGACIGLDNFIYLFSGSGVGGALFLDGTVHKGAAGLAGELGHIKIVPQGRFCTCGAAGCLSAYLSESALLEEVERLSGSRPESFRDLLARADNGDAAVLNVLDHAGDVLGSAVSSLINIFNPPVVLLGGDLALGERYVAPSLERSLQRLAHPAMNSRCTVRFAGDGSGRPRLGGVALALDGVTGLDGSHVLP
nr:ROK family protein [Rubellimicrobium arenae]